MLELMGLQVQESLLERNRSAVGKSPWLRRACVHLALHLLRVSSRLPNPPLLPARPIYVLRQTVFRPPAASFEPARKAATACGEAIVCVHGPSCTGFFLFSTKRPFRTSEKLVS